MAEGEEIGTPTGDNDPNPVPRPPERSGGQGTNRNPSSGETRTSGKTLEVPYSTGGEVPGLPDGV